jgi:UDP-glucose 4-epimerase
MECGLYSELYGLDTVCLRYFNVYSPNQKADGPYATAIANFMEHIRSDKVPFITGTGEQSRDMLHLEDAVSANIFAMNHKERFDGKNYDVGVGEYVSLNEIRSIVLKYFPKVEFKYIEERPGDVFVTKADVLPLKQVGWSAKIRVIEGVEGCFSALRDESDFEIQKRSL